MKKILFILTVFCICVLNCNFLFATTTSISNDNSVSTSVEKGIEFNKKYGPGRFVAIVEKNTDKPAECKSLKKIEDENGHETYLIDIESDSTSNGKWKLVVYKLNEKYESPKGTYWFTYYDEHMKKVGTCVAKKVK